MPRETLEYIRRREVLFVSSTGCSFRQRRLRLHGCKFVQIGVDMLLVYIIFEHQPLERRPARPPRPKLLLWEGDAAVRVSAQTPLPSVLARAGTLPAAVGNLHRLRTLNLGYNQLLGEGRSAKNQRHFTHGHGCMGRLLPRVTSWHFSIIVCTGSKQYAAGVG